MIPDLSQVLWAQIVGGAGFLVLVVAPLTRTRRRFLLLDILGMVPVGIHYLMLKATGGAALCAIYILMDLVAFRLHSSVAMRRIYYGFYPVAAMFTAAAWTGPADLFALAGTLFAVASRQQPGLKLLKFLVFLSAVGWGIYGVLAGSVSQTLFSVFYGSAALFAVLRGDNIPGR